MGHSPMHFGGLQLHGEGHRRKEYGSLVGALLPAGGGVQGVAPRLAGYVVAIFCWETGFPTLSEPRG